VLDGVVRSCWRVWHHLATHVPRTKSFWVPLLATAALGACASAASTTSGPARAVAAASSTASAPNPPVESRAPVSETKSPEPSPPPLTAEEKARAAALAELLEAGRNRALGLNRFDDETFEHFKEVGRTLGVPEDELEGTLYSVILRSLRHIGERDLIRAWAIGSGSVPIARLQALYTLQLPSPPPGLGRRFAPEDVPAIDSILDLHVLSTQIEIVATPALLEAVLKRPGIMCNFHGSLLWSLGQIDSDAARTALRRIADDRSRTLPVEDTWDLLRAGCAPGGADDSLARALSSERWLALVMLGDRDALGAAARDPSEPAFFRKWSKLVAEQKPYFKASPTVDHGDLLELYRWSKPCRVPL